MGEVTEFVVSRAWATEGTVYVSIWVRAPGYRGGSSFHEIEAERAKSPIVIEKSFVLEKTGVMTSITVIVRDTQGLAVAGALVHAVPKFHPRHVLTELGRRWVQFERVRGQRTNGAGECVFPNYPPTGEWNPDTPSAMRPLHYEVQVQYAPEAPLVKRETTLGKHEHRVVFVTVPSPTRFVGRVVEAASGAPVAGAVLAVARWKPLERYKPVASYSHKNEHGQLELDFPKVPGKARARTDSEGRFEIRAYATEAAAVADADPLYLFVRSDAALVPPLRLPLPDADAPKAVVDLGTIEARRPARLLHGIVETTEGHRVAGVRVYVIRDTSNGTIPPIVVFTDANGVWRCLATERAAVVFMQARSLLRRISVAGEWKVAGSELAGVVDFSWPTRSWRMQAPAPGDVFHPYPEIWDRLCQEVDRYSRTERIRRIRPEHTGSIDFTVQLYDPDDDE